MTSAFPIWISAALLVLGKGFDVRALETARRLQELGANVHVWLLVFQNGQEDSELRRQRTAQNADGLLRLYGEERISEVDIDLGGPFESPIASHNTYVQLRAAGDPTEFDDIIVDISAMPRMEPKNPVGS